MAWRCVQLDRGDLALWQGRACQRERFSKGAAETGSQGPVICGWRTQHQGQKWVVDDTLQPNPVLTSLSTFGGGGCWDRFQEYSEEACITSKAGHGELPPTAENAPHGREPLLNGVTS